MASTSPRAPSPTEEKEEKKRTTFPDLWEKLPSALANTYRKMLPSFHRLRLAIVRDTKSGHQVLPMKRNQWFRALEIRNPSVIILGQDPYPNRESAEGLAFSVPESVKSLNGSLRNIAASVQAQGWKVEENCGSLQAWHQQGVMLLNTALTVREWVPGSHTREWKAIMEQPVKFLALTGSFKVWLLWGSKAQAFQQFIPSCAKNRNKVLTCIHPSPFNGSLFVTQQKERKHFVQANQLLEAHGRTPIDWSIVKVDKTHP